MLLFLKSFKWGTGVLGILLSGCMLAADAIAAPSSREQQRSELVAATVAEDEVVWLEAGGERFLSLLRPALTSPPLGAAILLHSLDGDPNAPNVVAPLRNSLPESGWTTLSVQLPLPETPGPIEAHQPLTEAYRQRIQAAITHLQSLGIKPIVLIGYGMGATAAGVYLSNRDDPGAIALVMISPLSAPGRDNPLYLPGLLRGISLPIVEIRAARDLAPVIVMRAEREDAARRSGAVRPGTDTSPGTGAGASGVGPSAPRARRAIAFRQIEIAGADHSYIGFEPELRKRILGWLRQLSGGNTGGE